MKYFFTAVLILAGLAGMSQQTGRVWTAFHNGTLNGADYGSAIVADDSGNVYVTGRSFENNVTGSIVTVKYDSNGTAMWTDFYKGPVVTSINEGKDICIDTFGNILVTGTVAMNDGDIAILKFGPSGRLWAKNKEPWFNASFEDEAREIATDAAGNIYCSGSVMSIGGNLLDLYTLKCDSAGENIWSDVYTSASGNDFAQGFAVTPDGHAFSISGSFSYPGSATYDFHTLHYDSSGNRVWTGKYNHATPQSEDYPVDITCDDNYNTWVCGAIDVGTTTDMAIVSQDPSGALVWDVTYDGSAGGHDTAIAVKTFQKYAIVTGRSKELVNGIPRDVIITMLIDSGVVVWTQHFYGDTAGAIPTAMEVNSKGDICISGYAYSGNQNMNGVLLVYDINGVLIYSDIYDGGSHDRFNALTIDANDHIIVTGQTFTNPSNANVITIKYGPVLISGISETPAGGLLVYPNPSSGILNISLPPGQAGRMEISDLTGRLLYSGSTPAAGKVTLDLRDIQLIPGIYMITLVSGSTIHNAKFIFK